MNGFDPHPPRYDAETSQFMQACDAKGVFVVILDGRSGCGSSFKGEPGAMVMMPKFLRLIADQLERDIEAAKARGELVMKNGELVKG